MRFEVDNIGWRGEIHLTDHPRALTSCSMWVESQESEQQVHLGLDYLMKLIAAGRQAVIRVGPEVVQERDFPTQISKWRGYARFHFSLEPGAWTEILGDAASIKFANLPQVQE